MLTDQAWEWLTIERSMNWARWWGGDKDNAEVLGRLEEVEGVACIWEGGNSDCESFLNLGRQKRWTRMQVRDEDSKELIAYIPG